MTNGEKIKEIFPNFHINEMSHTVWVGYEAMSFRRDWWNAEYKEPSYSEKPNKSEIPTGSTTKNDLAVDCVSRDAVNDLIIWYENGNKLNAKELLELVRCLPSVTPQEPTTKNDLAVDWDELKRKIFMEVDGGTDDRWLRYVDVCDRISNSIDEFVSRL